MGRGLRGGGKGGEEIKQETSTIHTSERRADGERPAGGGKGGKKIGKRLRRDWEEIGKRLGRDY
jgi:hypothetical protein